MVHLSATANVGFLCVFFVVVQRSEYMVQNCVVTVCRNKVGPLAMPSFVKRAFALMKEDKGEICS